MSFLMSRDRNSGSTEGSKMYLLSTTSSNDSAKVYSYNTTNNWETNNTTQDQSNLLYSGNSRQGQSLFFKPDGTKLYVANFHDDNFGSNNGSIKSATLSTAWDISTASVENTIEVDYNYLNTTEGDDPTGIVFKPDGTKMYTSDYSSNTLEWDLSTAWDISTASVVSEIAPESSEDSGIEWNGDGTKFYRAAGHSINSIWEYDASTAWDITTITKVNTFDTSSYDSGGQLDIKWGKNGEKLYLTTIQNSQVHEFDASTPYDTSTLTHVNSKTVGWDRPSGVAWRV